MTPPAVLVNIIRDALEAGKSVEIEGLGTFRRNYSGGFRLHPETAPKIFVAYAVEDLPEVRRLSAALRSAGCAPWLDKEKLVPGQNWPRAIERAIETADVFLACFSPRSIAKRGHFQSELRYALDCSRRLPLDRGFVIPVRLERCAVPRSIADQVQYVDLFPDWNRGLKKILRATRSIPTRPRIRFRAT